MIHGEDLGTCLNVPRIRRGALEYYVDIETLKHSEEGGRVGGWGE